MRNYSVRELERIAAKCRRNVLRMIEAGGHGHMGGALSCIDILSALYFHKMRIRPNEPGWEDRDRFILSAGHKCMAQYAVLAERGFFPKTVLDTYGKLDSKIPGHPDMRKLPGIEANTGALGHGLAIACGMAIGLRENPAKPHVYVVMGDGELAEGSNWEAAAAAAHYRLDRLVAFVDFNGLQISGKVEKIMNFTPIADRFSAFGWAAKEIDGNSIEEIIGALDAIPPEQGKPTLIVARTIKAKGLSFAENRAAYHFWTPKDGELEDGISEIEREIRRLENAEVTKA